MKWTPLDVHVNNFIVTPRKRLFSHAKLGRIHSFVIKALDPEPPRDCHNSLLHSAIKPFSLYYTRHGIPPSQHPFHMLPSHTYSISAMTGLKGSTNLGLIFFTLIAMSCLFRIASAEDHSPSLVRGNSPGTRFLPRLTKMTFNEDWSSDTPMTCTCTCQPAPEAPPQAPSQQSPGGRKRSPPPAPYYQSPPPSPVYESPAPPADDTKSPVTFSSPPPPSPYHDAPSYGQPAPVVSAPDTFVPASPPPSPVY